MLEREQDMPSTEGRGSLPTTSYAILGLLTFGEMSGYDLKRLADQSIGYFFWSPARSQVYAELRRLTSLGFVTETEVRQERRPDKRIYRLTPEGRRALSQWLELSQVEPDVFKSTFLLKIFFGSLTSPETIAAQVEERRRQVEERLAEYEAIEARIQDQEDFAFPYLTLKSGMAVHRMHLQWTQEVLEELKERQSGVRPTE